MIRFYVSCRPIQLDADLIFPARQLKTGFQGMDISHSLIAVNRKVDGRVLYEIVVGKNSDLSEQELTDLRDAVVEGLAAWSGHLKTLESAKELAEKITGLSYGIQDDRIECLNPVDPRS